MADSNQRLTNKVNTLRQQIENDQLAKFQHELVVKDLATLPADTAKEVKDRFVGQARGAELEIAVINQRLSVREPLLVELEAQLEGAKAPA